MKKYSLLIVDDQANWRDVLVGLFKNSFNVVSTSSYGDALKSIRRQHPSFHVVITDMRLNDEEQSNEDGLKLIEELNKDGSETKSIVITGYPTVGSARRALAQLQAYDYFEKHPSDGTSFDIAAFRSRVQNAAEEAELQRLNNFNVLAEFTSSDGETSFFSSALILKSGESYQLKLSLQNKPSEFSLPIRFNQANKLSVFLFAEHMEVLPGTEWTWDVAEIKNSVQPLVTIVPKYPGQKTLMLEIQQNFHQLLRISHKVNVT
jgi:ActR/RegA family two-component response regulator